MNISAFISQVKRVNREYKKIGKEFTDARKQILHSAELFGSGGVQIRRGANGPKAAQNRNKPQTNENE